MGRNGGTKAEPIEEYFFYCPTTQEPIGVLRDVVINIIGVKFIADFEVFRTAQALNQTVLLGRSWCCIANRDLRRPGYGSLK